MLFNHFKTLGRLTSTASDHWADQAWFETRIHQRQAELQGLIGPNDIALMTHGGSAHFVADLLAIWGLGAAAACANPTLTENEKDNLTDFLKPQVLLTGPDEAPLTTGHAGKSMPRSSLSLDLPALYLFTSGTTGTPKGVEHSFRSLLSRFSLNQAYIGDDILKTTLCPLPTHFGHGLIGNLLTPLFAGKDVILLDDKSPMGLSQLGKLIDDYEVTFLSSVPSFWKLATRLSQPPTKNSLKRVHVGSAPLSTELWSDICEWAGTDLVFNMYGITETANWIGGVSFQEEPRKDGRIGTVWGGSALIKDTLTGEIKKTGEGELLIQTPSLMNGYFKQPELTEAVLKDGWFHTGDIGRIDENGDICITGRQKSEINRAGIKILPEEIDLLLERHSEILEVCVFGLPDEISGERVAAACVQKEGSNLSASDLEAWMKPLIRKEAIPENWYFVTEIPKTDRGKVNRDNVREVVLKGSAK
ncbi:class I adenylate-forming enzyme family protein [Sneathiella limimaris]|uniref:class I adenylate-forming enzyme family protein n=1 Tax=Sneathiella limimaris TaxID=1964213 RepID=UPI001469EA91|nr:class I adenylate-forming enzyme family protein [Sneathiella limimaris]